MLYFLLDAGAAPVSLRPAEPLLLSPRSRRGNAIAGGAAFTLTINGTNFVAASMVNFGGAAPATTFVNSTQLTVAIPASSVASPGTLAVKVTTPAVGGSASNQVNFTVTSVVSTVPTINYVLPSCVPAGEQFADFVDNELLVEGQNFVPSSVARWNGTDRPTTLDTNSLGTSLTFQISASDIATAGTAAVTVFNPAPGGGSSNSFTFTITPGAVDPQSIAVDPTEESSPMWRIWAVMVATCPCTRSTPPPGPWHPSDHRCTLQDEGTDSVTVDPFGKFAYVANSGLFDTSGSVAMYTINATTGALTSTGVIDTVRSPSSTAVDPTGKFAYVANGDGVIPNNVAMFTINATTGASTSIGTIPVQGFANSVVVDPTGKFAYVATGNSTFGTAGSVSMYSINTTTGALTSMGEIAAGTNPGSVAVDPTGKFAYVTNGGSNNVSMYTINATTGALTSIGTIAAGTNPDSVAVDPTGKFSYVTNYHSNDVSMYAINVTSGALTPIGTIPAGLNPASIAVHPSGKFAYVANSVSNDVSIYSIDTATGDLTLIGTVGT